MPIRPAFLEWNSHGKPASPFQQNPMSSPVVSSVPAVLPTPTKLTDLEIKDAQLIFESVWQDLEADFGHENLRFPKEIILLGGAPGAGKGTNTAFIARTRGLTCP